MHQKPVLTKSFITVSSIEMFFHYHLKEAFVLSSQPRPDRLRGPPSLQFCGYWGLFLRK